MAMLMAASTPLMNAANDSTRTWHSVTPPAPNWMPSNPWLAIDATPPVARELRHVEDDYLSEGRLDRVRQPIAESWRRSQLAGLDPSRARAQTLTDGDGIGG